MGILPRGTRLRLGHCICRIPAVCEEHCIWDASAVLSIREAVLTVSPNTLYLGVRVPTTRAVRGPLWKPIRIWTKPNEGSSSTTGVSAAARIASMANSAMRFA